MIPFYFKSSSGNDDHNEYPFDFLESFLTNEYRTSVIENSNHLDYDLFFLGITYIIPGIQYVEVEYFLDTFKNSSVCSVVGIYNNKRNSWFWEVDFNGNDKVEEDFKLIFKDFVDKYCISRKVRYSTSRGINHPPTLSLTL